MFDDDHYSVPVLFIKRFLLVYYSIGLLKDAFVDLRVIFNYYKYSFFVPYFMNPLQTSAAVFVCLCSFYYISPPNATFYS